jgi:hypothetical protein
MRTNSTIVSLYISIIVELVLILWSPFTSVLLLNLFSFPGLPPGDENKFNNNTDVKGYRGMRTSSTPVSLYISIIVELVLTPWSPFTSVLLLNLFSSPGIPLHQYYC